MRGCCARALAGPTVTSQPHPPTAPTKGSDALDAPQVWRQFAGDLPAEKVLWSEIVPGGCHASWLLARGTALRLVALDPSVNCSVVLYALPPAQERYNMPDSLKAQHTAHYTWGHVLMSDMGRAIASITQDSLGWHDPLGSLLNSATMQNRYGAHRYEQHRNAMHRSGRDGLLIEIGKYGLGARDLIAPVNFFSKVSVDEEGRFHFAPQHAPEGASVEVRMDMDVLLALSCAPHALDSHPVYQPGRVGIAAWRRGPAAPDDYCRNFCPENQRAHYNSERFAAR